MRQIHKYLYCIKKESKNVIGKSQVQFPQTRMNFLLCGFFFFFFSPPVVSREAYWENMPSVLGLDDCPQITLRIIFYQDKFRIVKWQISWERWCSVFYWVWSTSRKKQLMMLMNLKLITQVWTRYLEAFCIVDMKFWDWGDFSKEKYAELSKNK